MNYYRLEGHTPVRMMDFIDWAMWMEQAERHVGHDQGDGWELSTVFLGRDLLPACARAPELFETALFRQGCETTILGRFTTWEDAAERHVFWRERLLKAQNEERP